MQLSDLAMCSKTPVIRVNSVETIPAKYPLSPGADPLPDFDNLDDEAPVRRKKPRSKSNDDDDDEPIRAKGTQTVNVSKVVAVTANVLHVLSFAAWIMLFGSVLLGGLLFCSSISKKDISAIQEAAAGAVFSTVFIGLYVLARCLEKVCTIVDRLHRGNAASKN